MAEGKTHSALAPDKVWEHLLDAGVAEISAAAELLRDKVAPRATVRALSEAARGIELVIKALVVQIHWTQAFEDPASASLDDISAGNFKSPSTEECLDRLDRLAGVKIGERDRKRLKAIRTARNEYEHFGRTGTIDALRGSMGGALHSLIELLTLAEKSPHLPFSLADERSELAQELAEFDRFAKARLNDIKGALNGSEIFECPKCSQPAATIEDGLYCHFCVMRSAPETAARYYVETTRIISSYDPGQFGESLPVFTCPNCDSDALVQQNTDSGKLFCFACSESWKPDQLERCVYCNRMVRVSDESGMCSECFSDRVNRDD